MRSLSLSCISGSRAKILAGLVSGSTRGEYGVIVTILPKGGVRSKKRSRNKNRA
jgi:hypothetical protein